MQVDRLWTHARIATLDPARPGLGVIEDGAVAATDGRIAWVGPRAEQPALDPKERIDLEGRWITPGLIDCHTHLVYGGNRAHEFELRLAGASYEEIARAGGGILSTVKATRAASEDELIAQALPRLDALIAEGVTTVEIKSGYGLEMETEARQLRAARRLADKRPVSVTTTFLGAHALPPEADGDKDGYIARLCGQMLPAIAEQKLADAVDAFMEGIAFSGGQTARVFEVAKRLGLPVKLHADQLSNLGGADLAARYGALSADHLEYTDEAGAAAMAKAGTVAVLLPGAFYFIRETQKPPVELFRKHGTRIAIATDSNPGSSPLTSLLLTMNMARHAVPPDCRRDHRRRDARSGARARALKRDRHAGSRQMVRSRHLECRAAGGAALSHRVQSAAPAGMERPVTSGADPVNLGRGPVSLDRMARHPRRRRRHARSGLPACRRGERPRGRVHRRQGRTRLRHQHGLRQTCERAHRAGRYRAAANQHRAVACRRRGRAGACQQDRTEPGTNRKKRIAKRLKRTSLIGAH